MNLVALGQRVQRLRAQRGMTLQELATEGGVSVSMLSAVERGAKAPTVVVLDRIATGLGVRLTTLVDEPDADRVVIRRAAEQDTVAEDGWSRTILSPVVPGVNFEWIRTTLPPGRDAGSFPAYAPGSHVFVVLQEGRLRLTVGERESELRAGDSAYFAADAVHRYANLGDRDCVYFVAALIMRPRTPNSRQDHPDAGRS